MWDNLKKFLSIFLLLGVTFTSIVLINPREAWAATYTKTSSFDDLPEDGFPGPTGAYMRPLYLGFPSYLVNADITNAVINYNISWARYIGYASLNLLNDTYSGSSSSMTQLGRITLDRENSYLRTSGSISLGSHQYSKASNYGFVVIAGDPSDTNYAEAELRSSEWTLNITYNPAPVVSGSSTDSRAISLSFKAMTDGTSGDYKLYRNGTVIKTFPYNNPSFSYTDSNLNPNTNYQYKLVDPKGRESALTSITTRSDVPSIPAISSITQTSLTLSNYKNHNPNNTVYEIYRTDTTANTPEQKITSSATTTFNDTGLTPGHHYVYRIKAVQTNAITSSFSPYGYATMIPPTPTVAYSIGDRIWDKTEGRGRIVLTWPSSVNAGGYKVYVHDGYTQRVFDVGNTTTWDSSVWRIYPSEAILDSYGNNTQTVNILNLLKGGLDLRDNPNKLYQKTSGTSYDASTYYDYWVSAYNGTGESSQSPLKRITLPNSTDNVFPEVENVVLNDGGLRTGSTNVKVTISAKDIVTPNHTPQTDDDYSGISAVQISNDNFATSSTFAWANIGEQVGSQDFQWTIPPGEGTKGIYVRAVDVAGNVGNPKSASIFLKDDNSAPTLSVLINDGAEYTTDPQVNILLNTFDDLTGITDLDMRFSFTGSDWTPWESFSFTKAINLPHTETGTKRVFAQVRDGAGNIAISSDQIKYMTSEEMLQDKLNQRSGSDIEPPKIETFSLLNGATATTSSKPTVELSIYDNVSDFGDLKVQFRLSNTEWTAPQTPDYTMTPDVPLSLGMNSFYLRVIDKNGNKIEKRIGFFKL